MPFKLTLTDPETHMPDGLGDVDLLPRYVTIREYNMSRLKLNCNHEFYLALTPFTMHGVTFYFRTYKEAFTEPGIKSFINNLSDIIRINRENVGANYQIHIYNTYNSWDHEAMFKELEKALPTNRVINAACAMNVNHKIRVFRVPNTNQVLVFTSPLNPGVVLKIIAVLPLLFESLLPDKIIPDVPTAYPLELFQHLGNLDYDKYVITYKFWYSKQREELEKAKMITTIKNFDKTLSTSRAIQLESQNKEYERRNEDYYKQIEANLSIIKNNQIEMAKLEMLGNPMNELTEYLLRVKCLKNCTANGTYLYFTVFQPLNIFDEDSLENYIKSERNNKLNSGILSKIYKRCLYEQKETLWCTTYFYIDFISGVYGSKLIHHIPVMGIPNPHLNGGPGHRERGFNCWGNNGPLIQKAWNSRDYIIMFEQCLAACRSFNVHDTPVIDFFDYKYRTHDSYYTSPKCIQTETDEWLTLPEYIEREEH